MGSFLVIVPDSRFLVEASRIFDRAVATTGSFPVPEVREDWCHAAAFPRRNGTGGDIAVHPQTQSWLLSAGTWFHNQGASVAEGPELLDRIMQVGAARVATELNGFYVLVFGDARDKSVTVITDRIGSYHAYVRETRRGVAISSSALLLARLGPYELDALGCQEFLHTGVIYEDRTFYWDVRKLAPASLIEFAPDKKRRTTKYWCIDQLEPESLDGDIAIDRLWNSLVTSAEDVARHFPRIVCDLTGGYDSRATVAAFLGAKADFSTAVSGDENNPDVCVSRALAAITGKPHSVFPRFENPSPDDLQNALQLTDGECDLLEYAGTSHTHQELSRSYDISINGSFGEVARGYWWEILLPRIGARRPLNCQKLAKLRFDVNVFDKCLFRPEYGIDFTHHLGEVVERTTAQLKHFPNTFQMDAAYLGMRMQRWQGRIASSTNRLWPCLSPFMFRDSLETMLQTKAALRTRSLLIRSMLARYQPALAAHPLEHGYPAVPASLTTLHKFWPIVPEYTSKVVRKLRLRTPAKTLTGTPLRLRLWEDGLVRDLLDPRAMKLAQLLNPGSLNDFLGASHEPAFVYDLEWRRMLGVELGLRTADETLPVSDMVPWDYSRASGLCTATG